MKEVKEIELSQGTLERLDSLVEEILENYSYDEVTASVRRVLANRTTKALGKSANKLTEAIARILGPWNEK